MNQQLLTKISAYCARAEHCTSEVVRKLSEWDVPGEDMDEILTRLREGKFLDDARYAVSFAREKLRMNQWGRVKIRHQLETKEIPEALIEKALSSIPDEEYTDGMNSVMEEKWKELSKEDQETAIRKLYAFALSRGFEEELVEEWINSL